VPLVEEEEEEEEEGTGAEFASCKRSFCKSLLRGSSKRPSSIVVCPSLLLFITISADACMFYIHISYTRKIKKMKEEKEEKKRK
jgi:hypothetical protein